jgi:hypothetical protein
MGKLLTIALVAAGIAPAEPDGVLVMGVVGREGSASAVHGERAVVANPRSGEVRARRLAGGTLCYGEVTAEGDRLLYPNDGERLSLPLSLEGAPRAVPDEPRRPWLPDWTAVHGTVAGRLLIESGRRLMLWDRDMGEPVRTIRTTWLLAAGRTSFAWCGPGCHTLGVWSPSGERRFRPPPGTTLYIGKGALSPDGERLAVPVTKGGRQRAAVLDLATESWTIVPGGALSDFYVPMAWSPSGEWLYLAGRSGRLFAWQVGDAAASRLAADPGGTVMSIATVG